MSDNSSSTGSSSSSNSWTMLNPEEAAVESVGPVDDGTESLGDIPSLSEEMIVTTMEAQPVELVLSEEGQQVCQETAPEASEGPVPSSPTLLSPSPPASHVPLDLDWDSQPPVIHDIMTSSPTDNNDQLSAMPFVTNVNLLEPHHVPFTEPEPEEGSAPELPAPESAHPETPALDAPTDGAPVPASPAVESPAPSLAEASVPTEIITPAEVYSHTSPAPEIEESVSPAPYSLPPETIGPPADVYADTSPAPEIEESVSPAPYSLPPETIGPAADVYADTSPAPEIEESVSPAPYSPPPETIGSAEPVEAPAVEKEETELPEKMADVGKEEESPSHFDLGRGDSSSAEDDGLRRRRNVPSFEAQRQTSDEDDEDEEVEFRLAEKKEEKQGFSLNKLIVAALVLLCLGSLFLSDDLDSSELSDADQDMTELLDKLEQENQQISQLEVQLQSQKEELDSALKAESGKANEQGGGALEKENTKLKEELLSLPGLQQELDTLRARVTELSQLTASQNEPAPPPSSSPSPAGQPGTGNQSAAGPERRRGPGEGGPGEGGRLKEELKRQKALLEESRKRLEGMKKDGGRRRGVREGLSEIQKRLTEQVERLGQRRPWESGSKWDAKKGKDNGKEHWKKDEKKSEKERKHGKDKHDGGRKSHKQNSHKEAWRKYQDEWDRKKDERRIDREQRKRERPWHSNHQHQPHQNHKPQSQNHHGPPPQQHHHHQPHQYDHAGFWEHQGEKLGRNVRPRKGCSGTEDCAATEGLYPVELSEFEGLLEAYLSKLEGATPESREELRRLAARFFEDGVFVHDRVLFSDFAGDVADILEDMADVLEDEGQEDDDALEEEMEEFEREALWKFGVTA